jgi:catalase-peroxidase
MAMNDEETVALIAGGHTFGKAHGAATRDTSARSPRPPRRTQGLGWKNSSAPATAPTRSPAASRARGPHARSSGRHSYFTNLFGYEWELDEEPGRRLAVDARRTPPGAVPDAHTRGQANPPMMFTTDLALIMDPEYAKISERFYDNPDEFKPTRSRAPGTS